MSCDPRSVKLPPRMKRLPLAPNGYPYFFTVQAPPGAVSDHRVINVGNLIRCGRDKLCGICGQRLEVRLWFVGGKLDVDQRAFGEPAMHEECMLYALKVCPHLRRPYKPKPHRPGLEDHLKNEGTLHDRPVINVLYLYRCSSFTIERNGEHSYSFVASEPLEVAEHVPYGLRDGGR